MGFFGWVFYCQPCLLLTFSVSTASSTLLCFFLTHNIILVWQSFTREDTASVPVHLSRKWTQATGTHPTRHPSTVTTRPQQGSLVLSTIISSSKSTKGANLSALWYKIDEKYLKNGNILSSVVDPVPEPKLVRSEPLKVPSHQIWSAWKWYGWIGLVEYKNRG